MTVLGVARKLLCGASKTPILLRIISDAVGLETRQYWHFSSAACGPVGSRLSVLVRQST